MRVVLLPEAREDQLEATAYYRRDSREAAKRFIAERAAVLRRIAQASQQFPFVDDRRQRALLHKFPYSIIFEQLPEAIVVQAILHNSRSDNQWRVRE